MDCIVCEPDLGPALRQVPTGPYAEKIIQKLEPLYFGFVEQAYRALKPGGRLVLVTPYIKTRSGQAVTMPIDEKLEQLRIQDEFMLSLKTCSRKAQADLNDCIRAPSLVEMDERHMIGREIHIARKISIHLQIQFINLFSELCF